MRGRNRSGALRLTANQARRANLSVIEALAGRAIPELRAITPPAPQPRIRRANGSDGRILEKHVLAAVIKYLRHHPKVASVQRNQSGVFMEGNRVIRVGFVGKLDLGGYLKGGRAYEIEVKRPGGKPSPAQAARIEKLRADGVLTGCVSSIEEAAELFK